MTVVKFLNSLTFYEKTSRKPLELTLNSTSLKMGQFCVDNGVFFTYFSETTTTGKVITKLDAYYKGAKIHSITCRNNAAFYHYVDDFIMTVYTMLTTLFQVSSPREK